MRKVCAWRPQRRICKCKPSVTRLWVTHAGQLLGLAAGGGYDYSNERDQGYCPDYESDDQAGGYSGDEADPGQREGQFLAADGRSFHVCARRPQAKSAGANKS